MRSIAFALLLLACSGKAKTDTNTGAGSGSGPAIYAKKVALSWGIEVQGAQANVYLAATDETGKAVSHPLGTFDGQCTVIVPAPEMKAVTGVHCANGAKGTELHAVIQTDHVIVLKMPTAAGTTPDPMARVEIARIDVPPGAAIEAAK